MKLTPIFKKISEEYIGRLKFIMVDASVDRDLASGYGVMGVPTLKFICSGRPIGEIVGLKSKEELKSNFEEILEKFDKCIKRSTALMEKLYI
jgi:thioredoxin-like negative regulator of GroEL